MAKHGWEIVGKDNNENVLADMMCMAATGGLSLLLGGCNTPTYTIRDEDGVEKQVTARNAEELGEKIAKGEFD